MGCAETINPCPADLPPLAGNATASLINEQQRLHLQHGPIDLIVDVDGPAEARWQAFRLATAAFNGLLESLVDDLPALRRLGTKAGDVTGLCSKNMVQATRDFKHHGLTPMAAVAGAVSDYILAKVVEASSLHRVMVNNGGDIAIHLGNDQSCKIGIVVNPNDPTGIANILLSAHNGIGGVASSGWHGRSLSLGIADSVTVLASNAATADALATLLANSVTVAGEHHEINREPASSLDPDSDLGDQFVTTSVGVLSRQLIDEAICNGRACAQALLNNHQLIGACIHLQGHTLTVGDDIVLSKVE